MTCNHLKAVWLADDYRCPTCRVAAPDLARALAEAIPVIRSLIETIRDEGHLKPKGSPGACESCREKVVEAEKFLEARKEG